MKPRYIDYIDLEGSFEELVEKCRVLGPSLVTKNELAVEGFLGEGYFVRKDAFTRNGQEIHRIYVEKPESIQTLTNVNGS